MITTMALLIPQLVHAQESDNTANATAPTRPAILPNRWEEDWSVLPDPRVPREPLDSLKYMPLSPDDSKTYLSLGADFRERFEANDAANFGVSPNRNNDCLISRTDGNFRVMASGSRRPHGPNHSSNSESSPEDGTTKCKRIGAAVAAKRIFLELSLKARLAWRKKRGRFERKAEGASDE
jgi:hypothetical protein